jgi:hypothetical protein
MARGKYLSLEEARKQKGGLARFAKEHPSEGSERLFDRLLRAMALGGEKPKAKARTSSEAASSDCDETRTPKDTSEDA